MSYGFRIYAVEAYRNRVKGEEPADVKEGGAVHQHVLECLEEMDGRTFFQRVRLPADPDADRPPKRRRSISFRQHAPWPSGWIHIQVSIGREGDHDRATAEGHAAVTISHRSAESRRFVTLIFPPEGDRFLLVSEVFAQGDARELVLRQLASASMRLREAKHVDSQKAYQAAKAGGESPLPKVQPRGDRYIFRSRQLVDGEYLDDLLTRAHDVSAEFTLNLPSPRGGGGTYQRKKLVVRLLDEDERLGASRVSRSWIHRRQGKEGVGQREAIGEIDSVLSLSDSDTEGYDTVALRVTTADAERVTIGPLDAKEVFTYPLSASQCSAVYYYSKIEKPLVRVAQLNEIELIQIDHKEVAACLPEILDDPVDASTPEASSAPSTVESESEVAPMPASESTMEPDTP